MNINIMPCRYPLKPHEWPLRLKAGIERLGDIAKITQQVDNSDVHAFWGLRRPWGRQAIAMGKTSIIIERAYLGDRFNWLAFGLNGLNGFADFCNENVTNDRWVKFWEPQLKPWKNGGEYALVVGQVPGDASLAGKDIFKWYVHVVKNAKTIFGNVVFRPHPQDRKKQMLKMVMQKNRAIFNGVMIDNNPLVESLAGAKVVITYSSNVAVDAIMNGVPAISYFNGSMAWEVSSHNLTDPFFTGDRSDWGRRIAYAQWLPEEISNGTAWAHLREHIKVQLYPNKKNNINN